MPLRATGADAVRRKVAPKPGANAATFAADIRRRKQRAALFASVRAHASETNPKSPYRTTGYLASTPDPARYYTPQEIKADPALRLLVQNRRAAVADLRSQKHERTNVQRTQMALGMAHVPGSHKLGQIIGGAGLAAAYSPAGVYHLATTDPRKTAPEIARATFDPLRHPVRYWNNDPFALLASGYGVLSGGASVAGRTAAAVGAARAAEAGAGRAALKAALRRPGGGMRTIHHDGETTRALNTGSQIGTWLGKGSDRLLGLNKPNSWTTRGPRQGRVVRPAEYRTETVQLPNPARRSADHAAAVARAAADERAAAAAAAERAAAKAEGRGGQVVSRGVEAVPRTAADVQARLRAVEAQLEPHLKQLRAYYKTLNSENAPLFGGSRRKGDRYMTDADKAKGMQNKRGRKTFNGRQEATGSRSWDEEQAARAHGYDPSKMGAKPGGFRRLDAAAEAEKAIVRAGGRAGADPRLLRLKMLLEERDSLRGLLQKNQAGHQALFPEDAATGFGHDLRFTGEARGKNAHAVRVSSAGAQRLREAAARARTGLSGAEAAAAEAEAAAQRISASVASQRRRLVSAEVRKAPPPDALRPLRAAARWAAGHKFRSEQMQEERLRLAAELRAQGMRQSQVRRVLRSVNRSSRMLLLYSKLGYIPSNVISQEIMSLSHQGLRVPYNRVASAQLRGTRFGAALRKVGVRIADPITDPQLLKDAREASGSGRVLSGMAPHPNPSASERIVARAENAVIAADDKLGQLFGMVVDDPYRMAALVHELRRHGIRPRDIEKMLKAAGAHDHNLQQSLHIPGPSIDRKAAAEANRIVNEASRRANRAMIDYARMGKGFRAVRDLVFIAPWVKGATHYTMQFPLEHPAQTVALAALGQVGQRNTGLSPHQPYMTAGSFKVGERQTPMGRMPVVVNPNYVNTFKQPFDTGRAVASVAPWLTGVQPSRYNSILDVVQPLYGELGQQLEQGKGATIGGTLGGFFTGIPPVRLAEGVMHPATKEDTFKLYPRNQWDAVKAYVYGSVAAKPQNPVTTESIYRAEKSAGLDKRQRADLNAQWLQGDVLKKLNQVRAHQGLPPLTKTQGLASQVEMIHRHQIARLDILARYPEFHQRGKRNTLDDRGELLAAVAAILGDKPGAEQRIETVAAKLRAAGPGAAIPAEAKRAVRVGLGDEERARALIAKLNKAGAAFFPYTEGGAQITQPKR